MTVSGKRLRQLLFDAELAERLFIVPLLDPSIQIREGTIDVRIGCDFIVTRTPRLSGVNPFAEQRTLGAYQERVNVPYGHEFWIHPGTFVLGTTIEYIRLPSTVSAIVTARSSWARLGLNIAAALFVHPLFHGCLTFEIVNDGNTPVPVQPGARIAQLAFDEVLDPSAEETAGKYSAEILPQFTRLYDERAEMLEWRKVSQPLEISAEL